MVWLNSNVKLNIMINANVSARAMACCLSDADIRANIKRPRRTRHVNEELSTLYLVDMNE